MKNLFLIIIALTFISFQSCENNEVSDDSKTNQSKIIAKKQDGKIIFLDKDNIISKMESELKRTNKIETKLTNLEIEYSSAVDNDTVEIIQVIGSNSDNSIKISYMVQESSNSYKLNGNPPILSCIGCTDGCSPRRKSNGDGYCTKCNGNYRSCTKTETIE